nr:ATPase subunit 8 [Ptilocnemus lemur]
MPQMAPMWWTMLLFTFLITLKASMTHIYFLWTESKESKIKNNLFKMEYPIKW